MLWSGTDCQPALLSELHRGQPKDFPSTAHPPGLFFLSSCPVLSAAWMCRVATTTRHNSSVVKLNSIRLQWSFCLSLMGSFVLFFNSVSGCCVTSADSKCPKSSTSSPNSSSKFACAFFYCCKCLMQLLVYLLCCNVEGFDEEEGGAYGQSDYKQLPEVTVLCRV